MKHRNRSLWWGAGIIVLLMLAWVGYWYAAHRVAVAAIARLTTPANGHAFSCTDIALGGFPLRLDFRCSRGALATDANRVAGEIGGLTATAPLYRPGTAAATLEGPLTINDPAAGVALTATWSEGTAGAGAGFGGLDAADASFLSLKADNDGPLAGLTSLAADALSASLSPAGGGSYAIVADARQLAVNRADGRPMPTIDADIHATTEHVGPLGTNPARAFRAWLHAQPSVAIDSFRVAAAGAIVSGSGTLSLSPKGFLNGSLLLRYNSIARLADLIEVLRPGTRDKFAPALQGLQAMSKPVDTEDGPALQTTLTFTDGLIWLTIIPLPIEPIPPIRF